jgi:hypothetical protein
VPYEVLDRGGCIAAEPALALTASHFLGGLRLPGDETGDAHLFTRRLGATAAEAGVAFRYGTAVERITAEGGRLTGVVASGASVPADAVVLALGSYSRSTAANDTIPKGAHASIEVVPAHHMAGLADTFRRFLPAGAASRPSPAVPAPMPGRLPRSCGRWRTRRPTLACCCAPAARRGCGQGA